MRISLSCLENSRNILQYLIVQFDLLSVLLPKDIYQERIGVLGQANHIRYYVKVEQIKDKYLKDPDPNVEFVYERFLNEMNQILQADDANDNIKMLVRCELVFFEGSKINVDFVRDLALSRAYEHLLDDASRIKSSIAQ